MSLRATRTTEPSASEAKMSLRATRTTEPSASEAKS
ncbi:hypothetical protein ABIA39_006832 [Nocardia sp. GAS34]